MQQFWAHTKNLIPPLFARLLIQPRVRTRVIVPFLLMVLVIAGIGTLTVTRLVAGTAQERFNNQLADSARAASNAIVEQERNMLEALRGMVFTQGTAEAITTRDLAALDALLRPLLANSRLDELIVYDTSGFGIYRAFRNGVELSAPYESAPAYNIQPWRGAMRTLTALPDDLGDKFADVVELAPDERYMFISAPIDVVRLESGEAERIGGIAVGISVQRLAVRIGEQAVSSVVLYDMTGALSASTFRNTERTSLELNSDELTFILPQLDDSPLREKIIGGESYQVLYVPFRVRSESFGILGVGLPSNFIVQQAGLSRDTMSLLFGTMALLVTLIGVVIARSIVNPVSRLVETARAIMQGDLERRVVLKSRDELGELGNAFNQMTGDLVDRNLQIATLYQAQLQETAQREAILSNISDAVIMQDPRGNIMFQNPTAYRLMQLVSRKRGEQYRFDGLLMSTDINAPKSPELVEFSENFFSVVGSPVLLPSGNALGRVTVFRDFTAIMQAERLKDELILQMSHELRTPLAALHGNLDLIRLIEKKNLTEKGAGFLTKSLDHLATLERLVNQVVDVSTIIAEKFVMDVTPIEMNGILEKQAKLWQPRMEARDLAFEVLLPDDLICVEGDEERLGQVIDHLLRNAYSYTLPGGVVRLSAMAKNGQMRLTVADTGVGIQPEEMDSVFERMYRGSAAEAGPTDSRGMGLGLYLTKHIVEGLGGRVEIASEPQRGTLVRVLLPLSKQPVGIN
jgi:signal transduction histidine kinase